MAARVRARLSRAEARKFGLGVGAVFLAMGAVFWWRDREAAAAVAGIAGAALMTAGLVRPQGLGAVYRAWMGLARAISVVTTPITVGVMYFVVFTPLGLVMRVAGRKPLPPRVTGQPTLWTKRAVASRRSDLERQF